MNGEQSSAQLSGRQNGETGVAPTHGIEVLRTPSHYEPGEYLTAGTLCSCVEVCVAIGSEED